MTHFSDLLTDIFLMFSLTGLAFSLLGEDREDSGEEMRDLFCTSKSCFINIVIQIMQNSCFIIISSLSYSQIFNRLLL